MTIDITAKDRSLIHNDCMPVLRDTAPGSVDLVCTDPPYDLCSEEQNRILAELLRVSRHGAIVFCSPDNQWRPAEQYGFWVKPISTKNTSRRYSRFVEMIQFYGPLKWIATRHWSQYTNVFTDLPTADTAHPYEKPISLIARLLLNHTSPGDSVLDPFCGSGTTAVVARSLGRSYIAIESDRQHFEIACRRLGRPAPMRLRTGMAA